MKILPKYSKFSLCLEKEELTYIYTCEAHKVFGTWTEFFDFNKIAHILFIYQRIQAITNKFNDMIHVSPVPKLQKEKPQNFLLPYII